MLIFGNWKSYVEKKEDAKTLMASAKRLAGNTKHTIVVFPPAPFISLLASTRSSVGVGAQDVSDVSIGAATGEISAGVLKQAGATYVLVGHSERRARGENAERIFEKTMRALANGLIPVLCVGEKTRDSNATYLQELRGELDAIFSRLAPRDRLKVIVAYEPVWAIGKTAADAMAPADLREMVLYVRKVLGQYMPEKVAAKAKVLYGGSVEEGSARGLAESGVSGFLIGHASAEPASFKALVNALP